LWYDDRLVGLAPFFLRTEYGTPGCELLLLGTGISDYLDMLLDPEYEGVSAAAMFEHIGEHCRRWDTCDFQQLRPHSPLLETSMPDAWSEDRTIQECCPVLRLPAGDVELSRVVPSGMLKNLGYYRRSAEKAGDLRFDSAAEQNLDEFLNALFHLHSTRWAARGLPGVLSDKSVRGFHREAADGLLSTGALRFYALRIDGQIVATLYGFASHQRFYFYLGGFDPKVEHLSAGTLVIGHAIESAIREGLKEFDFLRGREAYKYRWGARDQLCYRRLLWRQEPPPQFGKILT
jgi:CelD/BcsL family acetyltransferase involved in cellulose biosynthesis